MNGRVVWFVAGTVAGVYASIKARRAAYRLSTPGMVDQAAAIGTGLRAFTAEVQTGMRAREHQVVQQLHDRAALPEIHPPHNDKELT